MSGHTPGPWKTDGSAIFAEPGNVVAVAINEDCEFGFISRVFGRDEQEANARLIAAAPDMIDALRQWRWAERNGNEEMSNARRSRDLAIAKAEEEAA